MAANWIDDSPKRTARTWLLLLTLLMLQLPLLKLTTQRRDAPAVVPHFRRYAHCAAIHSKAVCRAVF